MFFSAWTPQSWSELGAFFGVVAFLVGVGTALLGLYMLKIKNEILSEIREKYLSKSETERRFNEIDSDIRELRHEMRERTAGRRSGDG